MLETEERLFDEYKMVDNICRDIFSSQSGINQYITEMDQKFSYGCSVVPSWDDDYRRLKRVRWLRNQIAHESSATDCNEEDVAWFEEFHSRLLELRDPLALLRKADRERSSFSYQRESRPKLSISCDGDNTSGKSYIQLLEQQIPLALLGESNQKKSNFSNQRESRPKVVSEQRTVRNTRLRKKKDSSFKRVVVGLIVFVEILIILAAVAILLIYL